MADDLSSDLRYNAARAAAAAGVSDGRTPDEKERSRLRDQARRWLRADLAAWAKLIDSGEPERLRPIRTEARRRLTRWQTEPELVSLRSPKALASLPPAEQAECLALWEEVTAVIVRGQSQEAR